MDKADIVIIGGGIVGCSIAYHLTKHGRRDVLLLEQGRLSGGTTWHAAGLVGQLRAQSSLTRLVRHSTELYADLERETGLATGWKRCGSLTVARTPERMAYLRRTASAARAQGVEIEMLSPAEAGERWPPMRTDDLAGAVWLPGDGKANPADITAALARGARAGGATIREKTRVLSIETVDGRVRSVTTDEGRIACEQLVIAAGQWSRQVGALCGVAVPLHSAEHMYVVTEPMAGVSPDLPVLRDPDGYIYFKEEVGGLVMGGFEPDAKPWGTDGIPADFEFQLLPDDWDQFEILMENAIRRVPGLETAPIKLFLNGPESFTPDNNFLLGPAPECAGIWVAAGFNSAGIASAGGAGRALAAWMVEGDPGLDAWPVDIRRFARFNANPTWLRDRVKETLGLHYAMPWPNRELATARPFRRSPLHDRLAARGAIFGSKMGWERPNVFRPGHDGSIAYGFGRQDWAEASAAEHVAVRERVGLIDMTSFGKLLVQGRDAEAVLQHLCAGDVAVPVGTSVYTPMLDEAAGFESDVTVSRLGRHEFMVVTGSAQVVRDADRIRRRIADDARATVTDVTSAWSVLALAGPRSRDLLGRVSRAPLDDAAFPYGAVREIDLGYATLWAIRRSYAGELGWELLVPTEFAAGAYDALWGAGGDLGLADVGYYAVDSLRIDKGYRAWGREIGPGITPWEAGLGFAVKPDKGAFVGRDALVAARNRPADRRIVSLRARAPDGLAAWGGEAILLDGRPVGEVTSAAWSPTLGGIAALGLVRSEDGAIDAAWLAGRRFDLDVAGEIVPAEASLRPFHDPAGGRLRP